VWVCGCVGVLEWDEREAREIIAFEKQFAIFYCRDLDFSANVSILSALERSNNQNHKVIKILDFGLRLGE